MAAVATLVSVLLLAQGPAAVLEIVTDADGNVIHRTGAPDEPEKDPFIAAARKAAVEFTEQLPDFICEQATARKESAWGPVRWRTYDRVTAEVLYVGGAETYRNVKVNGKTPRDGAPEGTGTWSTGEYGTLMRHVLAKETNAAFENPRDASIDGVKARVYSYKVEQKRSRWKVEYEGHKLSPAFEGSIWFDPRDHRVLRLEMAGRGIPVEFPLDVVETTIDYGLTGIGAGRYLLPAAAECLACRRNSRDCTRNETKFRKYRKFTAESVVMATDSSITFDTGKRAR